MKYVFKYFIKMKIFYLFYIDRILFVLYIYA